MNVLQKTDKLNMHYRLSNRKSQHVDHTIVKNLRVLGAHSNRRGPVDINERWKLRNIWWVTLKRLDQRFLAKLFNIAIRGLTDRFLVEI